MCQQWHEFVSLTCILDCEQVSIFERLEMRTSLLPASTQINADNGTPTVLIDFKQTSAKVRMGRSRIYALIGEGNFPAPVKIGTSSRWIAHEIDAYIKQLAAARNSQLQGA